MAEKYFELMLYKELLGAALPALFLLIFLLLAVARLVYKFFAKRAKRKRGDKR